MSEMPTAAATAAVAAAGADRETGAGAGTTQSDDYIGLADSSSDEDTDDKTKEKSSAETNGVDKPTDAGTGKRKREDEEEDNGKAGAESASSQQCYNGVDVPPWLKGVRRLGRGKRPDVSEILNEEMTRFISYISPTPEEHQMRAWVIERLQQVLEKMKLSNVSPMAKCFGSFETRLYLPTSDIDITVMLYEAGTTRVSSMYTLKESIRRFLYTLAREMKQSGFCTSCEVIANARVPIIKTREMISGIAVDISINADSGMRSAAVQRSFTENVYPTSLRSLVLTIKQFLYQRSMNEVYTGGMGSYAVTLLAVSLLQMHPRVRSGGLDVEKNIGVMLIEFFELYGKRFNYDNTCVSVLEKGKYVCKRANGFFSPTQPYLLSIEDPSDPTNDVTKGTYGINRIKQTFAGAYDLLNNAIFAYHQTRKFGKPINDTLQGIAGYSEGSGDAGRKRARGKDGRVDKKAEDSLKFNSDPWAPVSFLSSIVNIDQRIINMRAKLVKTFYDGTMQKVLGTEYQPRLVDSLPPDLRASAGRSGGSNGVATVDSVDALASPAANGKPADFDFARMSAADSKSQQGNKAKAVPSEPIVISDNDEESGDGEDGDDGEDSDGEISDVGIHGHNVDDFYEYDSCDSDSRFYWSGGGEGMDDDLDDYDLPRRHSRRRY